MKTQHIQNKYILFHSNKFTIILKKEEESWKWDECPWHTYRIDYWWPAHWTPSFLAANAKREIKCYQTTWCQQRGGVQSCWGIRGEICGRSFLRWILKHKQGLCRQIKLEGWYRQMSQQGQIPCKAWNPGLQDCSHTNLQACEPRLGCCCSCLFSLLGRMGLVPNFTKNPASDLPSLFSQQVLLKKVRFRESSVGCTTFWSFCLSFWFLAWQSRENTEIDSDSNFLQIKHWK